MEESKESQYKYCLIVKNRNILKGVCVNVSLIIICWKPYATFNKKKSTLQSHDNKTDFVQWILIATSKSMHLVFHAKQGLKLE